jgi:curved DNA-binding protein CbpA
MNRNGQLSAEPLPALLHGLYREKLTGILSLDAAGGRSDVFLRAGYPVAVSSGGVIDQLGQVMIDANLIDAAKLREVSGTMLPDGPSFGSTLVQMGVIRDEQLREALLMQTRRRLHRLFFLERGSFAVEDREHDAGVLGDESLRIQPRRAIYQGVRTAWSPARVSRAATALGGKLIRLTADPPTIARYGFADGDETIVAMLEGRPTTLTDLAARSAKPIEAVRAVACVLHYTEALDLSAAPAQSLPSVFQSSPSPSSPSSSSARTPVTPSRPPGSSRPPTQTRSTTPTPGQSDIEGLKRALNTKLDAIAGGDLFKVLGIEPTATKDQVKNAYLSSAKVYHPDRFSSGPLAELRGDVEKLFRHINEAYATLYDDNRRAAYVAKRDAPASSGADEAKARAAVEAEMVFQQGKVYLRKRDFGNAVTAFRRAVELNPNEGEHIALLAWARVAAGQVPLVGIKEDLTQAIFKSPRCAPAHHYLGVVLREEGDLDGAIASLKRAIRSDERYTEAESDLRLTTLRKEKADQKGGFFKKK